MGAVAMVFDFASKLASEQALGSFHVKRVLLSPSHWARYPNTIQLNWNFVKFEPTNLGLVPTKYGVYSFVVDPGISQHPATHYLLYLGRARGLTLRTRYGNYMKEKIADKGRQPIQAMLNKWPDHLWFYYAEVEDITAIDDLEDELLAAYLPPFNQVFPAEVRKIVKGVFT
jgi:hypothetical protein